MRKIILTKILKIAFMGGAILSSSCVLAQSSPIAPAAKSSDTQTPASASQDVVILNTGFAVTVPANWHPIKSKTGLTFIIPGDSGSQGKLQIFSVDFRGTADEWQSDQTIVEHSLQHLIVGQRQEEILGVPLLFTTSKTVAGKKSLGIETGLLMNASNQKLYFRLEAPVAKIDDFTKVWDDQLVSLRTVTGAAPTPDDPSKPLTDKEKMGYSPTMAFFVPKTSEVKKEIITSPIAIDTTYATRKVTIHLPLGWKCVPNKAGWTLTHTGSEISMQMVLASNLDSAEAADAIQTLSANTLNKFDSVSERDEAMPASNAAGATIDVIFREGKAKGKEIASVDGGASNGEFYVLLNTLVQGRFSGSDKKIIDQLFDGVSITKADQ